MEKLKIRKKQGGGSARSGSRASRNSRGSGNSRSSGQPGTPVAGGSGQPASAASGSREPILSVAGGSGEPSHSAAGGSEQSSTPAGGSGQPSTPVASGSEQPNPHIVTGSEEPNPSAATLEHLDPPTADAGVQTTPPSGPPTVIHRNFPPEFWDELSRVWLTRRLVKEVGRRNYMDVPLVYERPQTRITLARFARHGGPDLRHLRNVSAKLLTSHGCLLTVGTVPRTRPIFHAPFPAGRRPVNRRAAPGAAFRLRPQPRAAPRRPRNPPLPTTAPRSGPTT